MARHFRDRPDASHLLWNGAATWANLLDLLVSDNSFIPPLVHPSPEIAMNYFFTPRGARVCQ
jgi:hypothetical protein